MMQSLEHLFIQSYSLALRSCWLPSLGRLHSSRTKTLNVFLWIIISARLLKILSLFCVFHEHAHCITNTCRPPPPRVVPRSVGSTFGSLDTVRAVDSGVYLTLCQWEPIHARQLNISLYLHRHRAHRCHCKVFDDVLGFHAVCKNETNFNRVLELTHTELFGQSSTGRRANNRTDPDCVGLPRFCARFCQVGHGALTQTGS